MLTELQTVILTCLLEPEDKTAFRKLRKLWTQKERRKNDPEAARETVREWRRDNPEATKEHNRKSKRKLRKEDPEMVRAGERKRHNNRYHKDIQYTLRRTLRVRLADAIRADKAKKYSNTMELLGCPWVWAEVHLESLFKPGMTWENHGPVWHIDHIKPCAKFDLTDPEQQKICFHWTNLQPLFAEENLKKGDKYVL